MLDFYDQPGLRLDIGDMSFLRLVIDLYGLLSVRRKAVFPLKMPVSFTLQPWIAIGLAFVRPVPRDKATAF